MRIPGRIWKDGSWWLAESPIADVMTQGKTRTEAAAMLKDAIESLANKDSFRVTVKDAGDGSVSIEASDPGTLVALVLKRQREANGLSLAQVAEKLGQSSRTAYARYEQGSSVPSVDKLVELLAAVAPKLGVSIGPKEIARRSPTSSRRQ